MDNIFNFLHRLILLFLLIGFVPVMANELPKEADLERDLRVMEQILKGLLQEHGNVEFSSTYIPGYGILMHVKPRLQLLRFAGTENGNMKFDIDLTTQSEKFQEEIKSFFTDYMIRLGNLPANEHVAVLMEWDISRISLFAISSNERSEETLPTSRIFYSAQQPLIEQRNSQRLSKDDFLSRMIIQEYSFGDSPRDLRVLENILKNEFTENKETVGSISNISAMHIPGLGVWVDVSLGLRSRMLGGSLSSLNIEPADIVSIAINSESNDDSEITLEVKRGDQARDSVIVSDVSTVLKGSVVELSERLAITYRQFDMNTAASEETFENSLNLFKELLLEYGNLIRDIDTDDSIILQVRLRQIGGELPGNTQLSLKKSLIESYQSGRISMEQAMDRIEVVKR